MSKFRVRKINDNKGELWIVTDNEGGLYCAFKSLDKAQAALDLYLSKQGKEEKQDDKMRQFEGGATRDLDINKLDYEAFLSPIVLERYAKYLNKHRVQSNGKTREGDNWQKMFGEKHFDVCMKSAYRHFVDWWKQHRGYKGQDDIADSICGLIFNAMAYLYKIESDLYKAKDKAYYDSITEMIDKKFNE